MYNMFLKGIMAQVKGVPILGLIKFIKKDMKDVLPKVLDSLPPDTRDYMDKHIALTAWYPYKLYTDLLKTLDKIVGNGDLSYCIQQGRLSAKHDLSTIYRIFLTFAGPKIWITRAMSAWNSYFDSGHAEVSIPSDTEALFTITDFPDIDIAHVKSVQGWLEQFLLTCNYTDVESKITKCQCYGDQITELQFTFRKQ